MRLINKLSLLTNAIQSLQNNLYQQKVQTNLTEDSYNSIMSLVPKKDDCIILYSGGLCANRGGQNRMKSC